MSNSRFWMALVFVLCALTLCFHVPVCAQSETTGGLGGQVVDPSGGAIGGATLTIVYVATGFRRTVRSDADGRFSFPQVQPGLYRIEADAPAFEHVQQPVTVSLGRLEIVALTLPIAGLTSSVSVSGEPPVLNTRNPNTTTTFNVAALE